MFMIALLLLIFIEILQFADIFTTEYGIKKYLAKEVNFLLKKRKARRFIAYPMKIGLPIVLYWVFCMGYKYRLIENMLFIFLLIVFILGLMVVINNIITLIGEKRGVNNESIFI